MGIGDKTLKYNFFDQLLLLKDNYKTFVFSMNVNTFG